MFKRILSNILKLEEEDKEVPPNFQLKFELDQMSIGKWNQQLEKR